MKTNNTNNNYNKIQIWWRFSLPDILYNKLDYLDFKALLIE